jgi:hypothetical protein
MTAAVCFKCGALKMGAMLPCSRCSARPASDDELVLSVAMTDHHYSRSELERIGREVANGSVPALDPSFEKELRDGLREAKAMAPGLAAAASGPRSGVKRIPWWKFWQRKKRHLERPGLDIPELGLENVSMETCRELFRFTKRELVARSLEAKDHPWYRDCARRIREGVPYFTATAQDDERLVFEIHAAGRITRCVAYLEPDGWPEWWFIDELGKPVLGHDVGKENKAVRPPAPAYAGGQGGERLALGKPPAEQSCARPLAESGEAHLPIYDVSGEFLFWVNLEMMGPATCLRMMDNFQHPLGMVVLNEDGSPVLINSEGRVIVPARRIN